MTLAEQSIVIIDLNRLFLTKNP